MGKITSYEIAASAQNLSGAVSGLALFAYDRLPATSVNRDDLTAFHGLLAAVKCLADRHEDMATKYFEDGCFKDESIEAQNNLK
ncbi:hypothetical protein [Enterococcus sp.]|uniref:hypothetical protein n=1 Tax=Enterococcus sp. TaxID=35783 RepID=UPI002FC5D410